MSRPEIDIIADLSIPAVNRDRIHRSLPAAAYHSLRRASTSNLRVFRRSPAHCWAAMNEPREPSPEMVFGEAAHLAVLQPELLGERFTVACQCIEATGKGRQCSRTGSLRKSGNWYCGQHDPDPLSPADDVCVLKPEDFDRALLIGKSVHSHPAAREMLEARTDTELSAIWTDPATGVGCKLRADMTCDDLGPGVIGDLKTTVDASPEAFAAAVWEYRYDLQAAFYIRGLAQVHRFYEEFRIIAVEKKPPFAVAVYRLVVDDLLAAVDEIERLLPRWRECEERGDWSECYGNGVMDLALPAWAVRKRDSGPIIAA